MYYFLVFGLTLIYVKEMFPLKLNGLFFVFLWGRRVIEVNARPCEWSRDKELSSNSVLFIY